MTTDSYERALELLNRAVAEKGANYVYPQEERFPSPAPGFIGICRYRTEDGKPSCIIGHVASYLGVLGQISERINAADQEVLIEEFGEGIALKLLDETQRSQDAGMSWGEAVKLAIDNIKEMGK